MATVLRLLRRDPARLFRLARRFRLDRYAVFSARTGTIGPPDPLEGVTFRKLSDQELEALKISEEEIGDWAGSFEASKYNGAYAVFRHGKPAHVAWLIPAEHDSERSPRLVKLRPGEAEITYCFTFPEFRGQGAYPFAIRSLFEVARERRIGEVFMITKVENTASQRGILKAGLSRCRGQIVRFLFLHTHLIYRGFRSG